MLEKLRRSLKSMVSWVGLENDSKEGMASRSGTRKDSMRIIRKGPAMRVIFFYPGEEGTYVDHADVTLYENGIVHIRSNQEETTTHLQNCEILWRFETDAEERVNKVRLLKPKAESRPSEEPAALKTELKSENKTGKGSSSKNPELVE
jgi:hypothetical protein